MNPPDDPKHTGQSPAHRPPDNESERVGEGELDIGPPRSELPPVEGDGERDEDLLDSD